MRADMPRAGGLQRELEMALASAPEQPAIRALYFDHLRALARTCIGLCEARLPELPHPLFFRGGTTDFAALEAAFRERAYDFPLFQAPERILVLGAGGGYAAVALASRYPGAQFLCVEAQPASFRLLLLNTLPYPRMGQVNAAAWPRTTRLQTALDAEGSYQLVEAVQGGITGQTVAELLRMRGWDGADLILCDGPMMAALEDTNAPWAQRVQTLASRGVAALPALEDGAFERKAHGPFTLFQRPTEPPLLPPALPLPLIHAQPGMSPILLRGMAPAGREGAGFLVFEDRGCQVPPNPPGAAPAQVVFTLTCDGQTRFSTGVAHAGGGTEDIVFHALIRRLADEAVMLDSARRAMPGASGEWTERIPVLYGPHEVVLTTEMIPGATSNAGALGRWIDPRLS